MQRLLHPSEMVSYCYGAYRSGSLVGLVPTMGALHEGHLALVDRARRECDLVVASIFVNPLQFNDPADLAKYPRSLEADLEALEASSVDAAFTPEAGEMHPEPSSFAVELIRWPAEMESAARPGHFSGVATVVMKLLAMLGPGRAYFGEKDFEQLAVVRRMVEEFHLAASVVPCPIVRDRGGLALSSRNRRLSPEGAERARGIHTALVGARAELEAGRGVAEAVAAARQLLEERGIEVEYFTVADPPSLQAVTKVSKLSRIFVAARVEGVRLIDNLAVGEGGL